ncbi:Cthe_2314 family HEPN domain-containing protein [Cohnella fermenti]|uniref:Cthe-2314-like HEPN domain-containing protein n=1 Tax=Cohnella fermenti TaxID=2565925 RepID=A0A4V3WG31_9BACL|nr:Cthe_2314 family HEPN domain-containing protein [Cohnella fermenti]THF82601.1 hypothetical protein E6C55_05865 [Cohnella fermenti]
MLRSIFGEPPRQWEGQPLEAVQAVERFIRLLQEQERQNRDQVVKRRTYAIWAEGLLRSLDELEQSVYAAGRYAERVKRSTLEEMSAEERLDYYRHVYYDKNAFIRVFSLLDKLGTLLNDLLELRTERVKRQFSYFTVLRAMRQKNQHTRLAYGLQELKERYGDAMNRLRKRRNLEIHHMNSELQDDLFQSLHSEKMRIDPYLENITLNLRDLEEGWEMVYRSLALSFRYAYPIVKS